MVSPGRGWAGRGVLPGGLHAEEKLNQDATCDSTVVIYIWRSHGSKLQVPQSVVFYYEREPEMKQRGGRARERGGEEEVGGKACNWELVMRALCVPGHRSQMVRDFPVELTVGVCVRVCLR